MNAAKILHDNKGTLQSSNSKPSKPTSNRKPTIDTISSSASIPSKLHPPQVVDVARCNHGRFLKTLKQNLRSYWGCFKPIQSKSKDKGKVRNDSCNASAKSTGSAQALRCSSPENPNYYSGMSAEECDEKLKSAILYCKNSTDSFPNPL
ncbi:hypothetical protein L1049_003589 [Liquidambar formosana]|uniref:Uncharacterized protein n=1 Tax=Liquidambar formosana TaxID=63359 RepID=A0AAP0QZ97_LIQFO